MKKIYFIVKSWCLIFLLSMAFPVVLFAGPPYDTDDPEPVELHHWEVYCSTIGFANNDNTTGLAPLVEVNYGAIKNLQLHVIAPMSFYSAKGDKTNYGYGDTEFGIKFRFINTDSGNFQVGIFPLVEAATGNANEGLGNGEAQVYIPLWIQKTLGKVTTYGGGGYWINPGTGHKNYQFIGWQAQYQFVKPANIGVELYYITASEVDAKNELRFRIGSIIDLTDHHHILLSIGRSIIGDIYLQWYLGYQFTI